MFGKKKIIIGIHGLGNKPHAGLLDKWWRMSINEGLSAVGQAPDKLPFHLVYWADILYPYPLSSKTENEDSPLYNNHPYQPATKDFIRKEPNKFRKKFLDYVENLMQEVFLSDDLSINFSKITDKLIHRYFKDLESYYKSRFVDEKGEEFLARDRIRERLKEVLIKHRKKEILLIAHSMGSIVAYDVLCQGIPEISVDTFVTLGSPLGIPVVIGKFAAEQKNRDRKISTVTTPESVTRNWFNMSDLDDRIALNYSLSDDYAENSHHVVPIDFIISNDYEYEDIKNPHSSFGYLRTPEMAKVLDCFLQYKNSGLINRVNGYLKRIPVVGSLFTKSDRAETDE